MFRGGCGIYWDTILGKCRRTLQVAAPPLISCSTLGAAAPEESGDSLSLKDVHTMDCLLTANSFDPGFDTVPPRRGAWP